MRCDTSPGRKSTRQSQRANLNLSYVVSQGRNYKLSYKNRGLEGSELLNPGNIPAEAGALRELLL